MRLFLIGFLFAALAPCTTASAQDTTGSPFSPENAGTSRFKQCDHDARDEVERDHCLTEENIRQTAALKGVQKASLTSETPVGRAKALAAQQAWLKYKDARCNLWLLTGGSGAGQARLRCLVRETITRRSDLEHAWDN
ncbi:lysozyme inhibitor LprI family protein [Novosphingobium sp. Fuku2-ISO-50]|uniref:lysozyme inhibitor LprI family protein n=1 Tax=Novosphingobium sp. Fuku2-ISO-50 TaxID=1739114 RepID=UPI0009EC15B9